MIFLGAGASAPFKIPTSRPLTDILIKILSDEEPKLWEDVKDFLTKYDHDVDFENILKILSALTDPLSVRKDDFAHQFRIGYGYAKDYSLIINKIYEYICKECTNPFNKNSQKYLEPEKIEKIFNSTYDLIFGIPLNAGKGELVFSTNYDPSIELWCQKRNLNCFDGSGRTHNSDFSGYSSNALIENLSINRYGEDNGNPIKDMVPLIRMHGSILEYQTSKGLHIKFNRIKEDLMFPDLYSNFIDERPMLIFPGQEDFIRRGPWAPIHRYFTDRLKGRCLFIGYSFRHEAINEPIIDNLINNNIKELGIFAPDPDENLKNLYRDPRSKEIPKEKIVKIKGEFGTQKGFDEFFNKWWSKHYSSINVFYNDIKKWIDDHKKLF